MKLKNYVVVPIIILTLILASCSSNKDDESDQATTTETQTNTNDEDMNDDSTTSETNDITETNNTDSKTEESDDDNDDIDVSLLDRVLLESVSVNIPDSFMVVSEVLSMDVPETTITYKKGLNVRDETTSEGVTSISIYNHDDKTTYDYTLGESIGYTYVNDDDENADKERSLSYNGMSLMAYIEQEFINASGWSFDIDPIIKASQDKVNGRKTINVSIIVVEETEEDAEPFMQIWFDKKTTVPMKYIINFGVDMSVSMEVTDYDFSPKIDDDLFIPPSDITFE